LPAGEIMDEQVPNVAGDPVVSTVPLLVDDLGAVG
jgi:hypothetical protein